MNGKQLQTWGLTTKYILKGRDRRCQHFKTWFPSYPTLCQVSHLSFGTTFQMFIKWMVLYCKRQSKKLISTCDGTLNIKTMFLKKNYCGQLYISKIFKLSKNQALISKSKKRNPKQILKYLDRRLNIFETHMKLGKSVNGLLICNSSHYFSLALK